MPNRTVFMAAAYPRTWKRPYSNHLAEPELGQRELTLASEETFHRMWPSTACSSAARVDRGKQTASTLGT